MMGYGNIGWMSGDGWLWMVLFMAVVIALVVWGAGTGFRSRGASIDPSPLDILRQRFAAGEITAAEFDQAKRAIV